MGQSEESRAVEIAEVPICDPRVVYPLWEAVEHSEVNIDVGEVIEDPIKLGCPFLQFPRPITASI